MIVGCGHCGMDIGLFNYLQQEQHLANCTLREKQKDYVLVPRGWAEDVVCYLTNLENKPIAHAVAKTLKGFLNRR